MTEFADEQKAYCLQADPQAHLMSLGPGPIRYHPARPGAVETSGQEHYLHTYLRWVNT